MDLLGDLGDADQLTSARAEIAVLTAKVKELAFQVKELTFANASLQAEVEMYRKDAALPNFSNLALGKSTDSTMDVDDSPDAFLRSGNGVFPSDPAVVLDQIHGIANPLCCALSADDTLLATGGADSQLIICQWGAALAPIPGAAEIAIQKAVKIECSAPVICTAFSQHAMGKSLPVIAAGCMDGSIHLIGWGTAGGLMATKLNPSIELKHSKYIKALVWCPTAPLLATASADGVVYLAKISDLQNDGNVKVELAEQLNLNGTVESICFTEDGTKLICYTRGNPFLSYFDLEDNMSHKKINLNAAGVGTAAFEDHVSFAVMDMAVSPNGGKFLALATDTSRNIIIDIATGKQLRNLYGHLNDAYSIPKICWSCNGQYIMGNTQEDGSICIWDVASAKIVKKLDLAAGGHLMPVRDLFSSKLSDTLVTTSYDKNTKLWVTAVE